MSSTGKKKSVTDVRRHVRRDIKEAGDIGKNVDRTAENLRELKKLDGHLVGSLPEIEARKLEQAVRDAFRKGQQDFETEAKAHREKLVEMERNRRDIAQAVKSSLKDAEVLSTAGEKVKGSPLEAVIKGATHDVKKASRALEGITGELAGSVKEESGRKGYDIPGSEVYQREHEEREKIRERERQFRLDEEERHAYEERKSRELEEERRRKNLDQNYKQKP